MGSRKSQRCMGKISGSPVTEYDSQAEAYQGAEYARLTFGTTQDPYRCKVCRLWHLAPKDRRTPSTSCPHCTGADGRSKDAYATEQAATRRASILYAEQRIVLRAYSCEYGQGWHLTKS